MAMAVNVASSFSADIEAYIADETLPLTRKQLVAYQFGDPLDLPKGRGTTYTATRYNRVPLPFAPLSEGVPPVGELMTITQVSATAQQWGDKITITDVAELTIKHPLFKKATELTALQVSETLERNTFNAIMAFTNVNYVNTRGARASLVAGDVLNPHEVNRAYGALFTNGAPRFSGDEITDMKIQADAGGAEASSSPRKMPHYVALIHPLVAQDMRENATVVTAWSYSDINRLYNYEIGEWGGIRFCQSNMVPTFTGFTNSAAGITYTVGTAGSLATNATYYIIVTGTDSQNQYESQIYAVSGANSVTGPNGSIAVLTPSTTGYTYNIYIGTTTTPATLGLTASGPTSGPLQGQAVQLPPATSVVITGIGTAQTPPAPPASTVTVYPTFIFGRGAYGQVMLNDVKFSYLKDADKSDPLNQLRIVGWSCFYGTLLQNTAFAMRIESTSAFSATYG
jgi:N4-gp56 family major capsid protein